MSNTIKNTADEVIEKLVKNFYKGSLTFSLLPQEIILLSWEQQKLFLDATVNNRTVKKYPMNAKFSRLFFKKLIELLENVQEIHDDIYTYLCSVIEDKDQAETHYYRHFLIGNYFDNLITTTETNKLVVNGTTGMRTWEAALMLADWILCNKHIMESKKVLELGAGVGFTGITIARECKTQSILLTDCHTDVLRTICDNVSINFPDMVKTSDVQKVTFKDGQRVVEVMLLDWNYIEDLPSEINPDILIGADIIYDPDLIQPLCNVIKKMFDRNNNLNIYLANVIRNQDTYLKFLEIVGKMNLYSENVLPSESVFIEWDRNTQFSLLNVKKQ